MCVKRTNTLKSFYKPETSWTLN